MFSCLDNSGHYTLIKKEVIPALEAKIIKGEFNKDKPKLFSHYSATYLKSKRHLKDFNKMSKRMSVINDFFGDARIDQITRGHVKDWVQLRIDIGNTPKTIKNYLVLLRGALHEAIDKEVISQNVAANIKLPSHKPDEVEPFSGQEVKLLLKHSEGFLQKYLAIGFYTGMRMGEILGLMYNDFDFNKKTINVQREIIEGELDTTLKTERSKREVPILDELAPYIKKPKGTFWILTNKDNERLNRFGQHNYEAWAKLLKKCGLNYRKPGSTRHTFIVSLLKNSDLSILEIAQMAGHTTTQMIIKHYGKYIKGEHLKIDRSLKLFTDKSTDSTA